MVISGSPVHEGRWSEITPTVKTLNQLTEALNRESYNFKRLSVYLWLLPENDRKREGKWNVVTAPVKLKHQSHPCIKFARATINTLEELAGLLGPGDVTFHSQNEKDKVPIGLTTASKEAPLLRHMEYKVTLPDHDYAIAPHHILIPSVIRRFCNLSWSYVLCHTKCKIFWLQHLSPSAWHETYTISWNIQWQFQKWYWSIETSHDSYHQWRSLQKLSNERFIILPLRTSMRSFQQLTPQEEVQVIK